MDYFEHILKRINSKVVRNILNIIIEHAREEAIVKNVPRNDYIIRQGDRLTHICFLISGVTRGYYIDEMGNDVTRCFAVEGDFVCSEGLRRDGEATFYIQALEDCVCVFLPYQILKQILVNDEIAKKIYDKYNREVWLYLENRQLELLMKDAKERYLDFLGTYPNLIERVDQKYIASYIGIRPSSLSRLKRDL